MRKHTELSRANLIYIAGARRSGSTLLDLLLGTHPNITGIGEAQRFSMNPKERLCACGNPISECAFWNRCADLIGEILGITKEQVWSEFFVGASTWTKPNSPMPNLLHLILILGDFRLMKLLGFISKHWEKYISIAKNSWLLYDVVSTVNNTHFVVDSSKNAGRLKLLYMIRPRDFKVIHLVRDGRAVVASLRRREGMSVLEAAKVWKKQNEKVLLILKTIPKKQRYFLRYEDLCDNPEKELKRLCQFLNIPFTEGMLQFRKRPIHNIPGSPMLFNATEKIIKDERWKQELSKADIKVFNQIAGSLNQKFGYEE